MSSSSSNQQRKGEIIDSDRILSIFESALAEYSLTGKVKEPTGNRNLNFVPADTIRTIRDLAHDPHIKEREAVPEVEDAGKIPEPQA